MSTTYNIEIREFNGIDYDILYPITTITNVNGLSASLDELSSNIISLTSRVSQNEINIISLENSVSSIDGEILSITSDISSIYGDISDLDLEKQDASDLGSLAFKNKAGLGVNGDVEGILPISNGGTGANTSSGALTNLGIIISQTLIEEGDPLPSGTIYICYQ